MDIVSTDSADVPKKALPYLQSVVRGDSNILRSQIYKDHAVDKVVDDWAWELLDHTGHYHPSLGEYEWKEIDKIGPKSVRLPLEERMGDIESYFSSARPPEVDLYTEINDDLFHPGAYQNRMRPLSGRKAADGLPSNTNSGPPWFQKRRLVKEEAIRSEAVGDYKSPAALGWRGQSNGTPIPKQRVVWIVSYKTNVREARYVQVAHEYLRNFPCFAGWIGMSAVDKVMTSIMNDDSPGVILSSDQSGWDQHTGPDQVMVYKRLMHRLFQYTYHDEINDWIDNVNEMPLVISPEDMVIGSHGLASGSGGTSQINSVVNAKMQLSSRYTSSRNSLFLGDDGVTRCIDVDGHLEFIEQIGYDANIDKQLVATDIAHFLQRLYLKEYVIDGYNRGIYMTMRALGAVLYPERFHPADKWSSVMETLRWIMIVENTRWHPAFKDFVSFILKGDAHARRNIKELLVNNKHLRVAKSIPGFIPQYTQEASLDTPIGSFQTVKVAKEVLKL